MQEVRHVSLRTPTRWRCALSAPITPDQMRMARAALRLSTRAFGQALGLSAVAVSRYERGDESAISVATARRIAEWFEKQRVFFGPKDGVCIGEDVFSQDRWYTRGLFQLLKERDAIPSSTELIAACKRANEPTPPGAAQ